MFPGYSRICKLHLSSFDWGFGTDFGLIEETSHRQAAQNRREPMSRARLLPPKDWRLDLLSDSTYIHIHIYIYIYGTPPPRTYLL